MAQTRTVSMLDRPPKAEQKNPLAVLASAPLVVAAGADDYAIDTDVPIPAKPGKASTAARFPWHRLEIGHSFLVKRPGAAKTAYFWCKWAMKTYPGRHFIYRKTPDGTRFWRVEAPK